MRWFHGFPPSTLNDWIQGFSCGRMVQQFSAESLRSGNAPTPPTWGPFGFCQLRALHANLQGAHRLLK